MSAMNRPALRNTSRPRSRKEWPEHTRAFSSDVVPCQPAEGGRRSVSMRLRLLARCPVSSKRPFLQRSMLRCRRRGAGRGGRAGRGRPARIVLVGQAFFHERGARGALQLLIVGAELARRRFFL